MQTLLLYSTKSGATMECANLLAQQINNCVIHDLSKNVPDISSFDTIIIGSGVRMGKFYKPVLAFIKKYEGTLLSKKIAFYLCNAYPDTLQKAVKKNISKELMQSAVCIKSFGGKQPFSNSNDSDWIISDNITELVQVISETK